MKRFRLFDADDTLWKTDKIIKQYVYAGFDLIHSRGVVDDLEAFKTSFHNINIEIFSRYGVAPSRWGHLLELLKVEYRGLASCEAELLELYNQIYFIKPKLNEGAIEILEDSLRNGYLLGLATFSNEEWGWRKLVKTGLYKTYFGPNNVYFFHEQTGKFPATWIDCFNFFNVTSGQVQVVGDSVPGDIIPPYILGVDPGDLFHLHTPTWEVNVGKVPEGVIGITKLTDINHYEDTSILYL